MFDFELSPILDTFWPFSEGVSLSTRQSLNMLVLPGKTDVCMICKVVDFGMVYYSASILIVYDI